MTKKFTILVDIDGVLAAPPDFTAPLPGAVEAIRRLARHFRIAIFSSRTPEDGEAWLRAHGIPYDAYEPKPLNLLIIDDRCLTFRGDWKEALRGIGTFQPWWKQQPSSSDSPRDLSRFFRERYGWSPAVCREEAAALKAFLETGDVPREKEAP